MVSKIGFWGYPNPEIVKCVKSEYPNLEWIDLDISLGAPQTNILPDNYCKIVKNIIDNSLFLKNDLVKIVAPIGKDKCDSGWFASKILKDMGFDVVESIFENTIPTYKPIISTSNLPLIDKVNLIMDNVVTPENRPKNFDTTKAKFGFWGVPPNDLEILKLFPNNTHIYGWIRCVEMGIPASVEEEMFVETDVPTVFYAQAFCSKCQLAKYLADKYNGLYIDIDDFATNSVRAKIEAFLKLR